MVSGTSTTASHDGPEPEREQLTFEVDTEGFTPETAALVEHIKQVAEDVLYHWKTFPLHLPSHVAVQNDPASTASSGNFGGGGNGNGGGGAGGGGGTGGGGNLVGGGNGGVGLFGRARPLILRDVFVTPSFDELDAVAVDSKGDPRRLSNHHLHSIREKGLHRDSQGKRRRLTDYQLETLRRTGYRTAADAAAAAVDDAPFLLLLTINLCSSLTLLLAWMSPFQTLLTLP